MNKNRDRFAKSIDLYVRSVDSEQSNLEISVIATSALVIKASKLKPSERSGDYPAIDLEIEIELALTLVEAERVQSNAHLRFFSFKPSQPNQ